MKYLVAYLFLAVLAGCSKEQDDAIDERDVFVSIRWEATSDKEGVVIKKIRATYRKNDGTDRSREVWSSSVGQETVSGTAEFVTGNAAWFGVSTNFDGPVFVKLYYNDTLICDKRAYTENGSITPGSHGSVYFICP